MSIYDKFSPEEVDVLRKRAERAAASIEDRDQLDEQNALSLVVNKEHYAVPIDSLQAVYRRIRVTPVPCSPTFVSGIANVRGRILPVLNLSLLLGAGNSGSDDEGVIVAANDEMTVAFQVQTIGEVMTFAQVDLEPVISGAQGYVKAFLPDGSGLLDMQSILEDPAIEVNQLTG